MALKKKPVTGMKDMLPREMQIRDYVIRLIKETYGTEPPRIISSEPDRGRGRLKKYPV